MSGNQPRFNPFGERARGTQQPKRPRKTKAKDVMGAPRQTKKDMTPRAIAAEKLRTSLNRDFTIPEDIRKAMANEVINMDSLRYMNMQTLAGALVYLRLIDNDGTRFASTDTADQFYNDPKVDVIVEKLLPQLKKGAKRLTPEERNQLIVRQKASLLRYILTVLNYRSLAEERARQAVYTS